MQYYYYKHKTSKWQACLQLHPINILRSYRRTPAIDVLPGNELAVRLELHHRHRPHQELLRPASWSNLYSRQRSSTSAIRYHQSSSPPSEIFRRTTTTCRFVTLIIFSPQASAANLVWHSVTPRACAYSDRGLLLNDRTKLKYQTLSSRQKSPTRGTMRLIHVKYLLVSLSAR